MIQTNSVDTTKGLTRGNLFWQKWAVRVFFFVGGFGTASWAPLIPLLKERLNIEEAVLGMLLLCIGIGSLVTMPTAATIVRKFGINRVLLFMVVSFAIILLCLSLVNHIYLTIALLFIFGAVMGAIDVVVNIAAVTLEKASKKQLMSGLHAMWSLGGFVGASAFTIMILLHLSPVSATLIASTCMIVLGLFFSRVPFVEERTVGKEQPFIAIPKGIVIFVGLATFISFLIEGAVMDWSGVFLLEVKKLEVAYAGLGFSFFSGAMLLMRFCGDALLLHFGPKKVVGLGALVAIGGFVMTMIAPSGYSNLLGFFLIGLGMANVVPTFYSVLGRQSIMPVGIAVAAVSTLGYLGILMGPAIIGFVAHITNLVFAFGGLAILLVILEGIMLYTFNRA